MKLTAPAALKLAAVPHTARASAEAWKKRLAGVWNAKETGGNIVTALHEAAKKHGVPFGTLRRRWYALQEKGIDGLIDQRKIPAARGAALPGPFVQFWKSLLEQHQRDTSGREAHRKLLRQWRAWREGDASSAIPGYEVPPPSEIYTGHPHGWSLTNLRRHGLTKYVRKLRRQGTMAALLYKDGTTDARD